MLCLGFVTRLTDSAMGYAAETNKTGVLTAPHPVAPQKRLGDFLICALSSDKDPFQKSNFKFTIC